MKMPLDIISGVKSVKDLVDLYRGAQSISNYFLMKKIEAFYENGDLDEKLVRDLQEKSIQEWESVQDSIMHSLTHAETIVKARYTRLLTESLLKKEIDHEIFMRFNFILQQLYSFDIPKIVEIKYKIEKNSNLCERLLTLGLTSKVNLKHHDNTLSLVNEYEITQLGNKFIDTFLADLDSKYKNNSSQIISDIINKPKDGVVTFF